MSQQLIAAVTRQAETEADKIDIRQVSDGARLKWSAFLLGPVAGVLLVLFLANSATALVLLQRQLMGEQEIPRRVHLTPSTSEVWPAGEEGLLRITATGGAGEKDEGVLRLVDAAGYASSHALVYEKPDGTTENAVFVARIPPSDSPFTFRAWLKDGRMREPGEVRYEPRPVVRKVEAWVQLPASIGLRSGGLPFEEPQKGGDILHRISGSRARVRIYVQKPVREATLTVLGAHENKRDLVLTPSDDGTEAEGTFAFQPGDRAYEVAVRDAYGFFNSDRPRRTIAEGSVEAPEVALVPETLWKEGDAGSPEDFEIEGIPIEYGQRFRFDYRCAARYGLSHAQVRYRVIPRSRGADEESGKIDREDFLPLPLGLPLGGKGPITPKAQKEFSTKPAADADSVPDTEGSGRYDFDTTGIPDGKGGLLALKEGDRIQFYVEVFGKAGGPPGRSVVREKEVVSQKEFDVWLRKKDDLKERTRYLEEQQRKTRPRATLDR